MLKKTIFSLLICLNFHAKAQDFCYSSKKLFEKDRALMINAGYTYQHNNIDIFEFGIKRTSISKFTNGDGQEIMAYIDFAYLILGGEILFLYSQNNTVIQFAPKIGIGYNYLIFNANINFIGFNTDFKTFYPAILPEIGFSIFGFFQLNYGYNFYLVSPNPFYKSKNRFSVRISFFINSEYWNGKKK